MKVYKFGGASVKDGAGIKNLVKIISVESENLVVVVSAFGKTTNALERVLKAWLSGDDVYITLLDEIYMSHRSVINELFTGTTVVTGKLDISFAILKEKMYSEKRQTVGLPGPISPLYLTRPPIRRYVVLLLQTATLCMDVVPGSPIQPISLNPLTREIHGAI